PFCVAALSAAEKRDYAELSSFRQPFQHLFLLRPALQTSLRQPTRSTPQPLRRLLCSAAVCCEGANIKRAKRGWQGVSENFFVPPSPAP
ncbi:hypothetical protein, partial [Cupriavidus necator]|uniref:hypothetical protein n=1 Tax=Cupriavidus necator TaxID=106590 RepID=UPI00339D91F4